jgi:hypothetical protein
MDADERLRFWEWVNKCHASGCWLWLGSLDRDGYGLYRGRPAHRWAWLADGRTLDPALTLDHLCATRRCVRPDHMEQVTRGENTARANRKRSTKKEQPK